MINRCICSNISFENVKEIAKSEEYATVKDLQNNSVCCLHCELCRPYIEKMLETGKTSFKPEFKPVSK